MPEPYLNLWGFSEEARCGRDQVGILRALSRAKATGKILDGFAERRDFQREMNYLASLLADRYPSLKLSTELLLLDEYEEAAGENIQNPPYAFDDALEMVRQFPIPSREILHEYLRTRADFGGFRAEDGLFDEMSTQLSGDREAWKLLNFCLRTLYQQLLVGKTGNKLVRAPNMATLDCRRLLADTARSRWLEWQFDREARAFRSILTELGIAASRVAISKQRVRRWFLGCRAPRNAGHVLRKLLGEHFVHQGDTGSYSLTHRSLVENWGDLSSWVSVKARKRRRNVNIASALASVILVSAGLWKIWGDRQHSISEANDRATGAARKARELSTIAERKARQLAAR